jgi:hypothetical protein
LIIARFVTIGKEPQQNISDKGSEFCCRFIHVREDILLTENTNMYTGTSISDKDTTLSKNIDIKGAIALSFVIVSFLITLQLMGKSTTFSNLIQIIIFSVTSIVSLILFVRIEQKATFPLIDFKLLKNTTYSLQI